MRRICVLALPSVFDSALAITRDVLTAGRDADLAGTSADGESTDLLNLLPGDVVSAEIRVAQDEIVDVVRDVLEELPEEQRQTFMLHHFDSLTLSEVADAMDTTLPTAKSRLRLAKEKLRYHLTCRGFADEETVSEMN